MPLNAVVTPGTTIAETQAVTPTDLNLLAKPTVDLTGLTGPTDMSDGDYSVVLVAGPYFHSNDVTDVAGGYQITLDPAPAGYTAGMSLAFTPDTRNTGAVTLNVNGLGAKSILKKGAPLAAGDIEGGEPTEVRYDGTAFQIVSPAQPQRDYHVLGGTDVAATITLEKPHPASYAELLGRPIRIRPSVASGIAQTLNVNGLGAVQFRRQGLQLYGGEMQTTRIYEAIYDGTYFQLGGAGPAVLAAVKFDGTGASVVFTAATATDILTTTTAHGWATGQAVSVRSETTLPAGLAAATPYYARVLTTTTLTLHTTAAGAAANTGTVDITSTGTGQHIADAVPILNGSGVSAVIRAGQSGGGAHLPGIYDVIFPVVFPGNLAVATARAAADANAMFAFLGVGDTSQTTRRRVRTSVLSGGAIAHTNSDDINVVVYAVN